MCMWDKEVQLMKSLKRYSAPTMWQRPHGTGDTHRSEMWWWQAASSQGLVGERDLQTPNYNITRCRGNCCSRAYARSCRSREKGWTHSAGILITWQRKGCIYQVRWSFQVEKAWKAIPERETCKSQGWVSVGKELLWKGSCQGTSLVRENLGEEN